MASRIDHHLALIVQFCTSTAFEIAVRLFASSEKAARSCQRRTLFPSLFFSLFTLDVAYFNHLNEKTEGETVYEVFDLVSIACLDSFSSTRHECLQL